MGHEISSRKWAPQRDSLRTEKFQVWKIWEFLEGVKQLFVSSRYCDEVTGPRSRQRPCVKLRLDALGNSGSLWELVCGRVGGRSRILLGTVL